MEAQRQPGPDAPRVFLRPVGNPKPLAFLATAGGTASLAALQLGWMAASDSHQVSLALIAFVAPLQLVAAIFGYLGRDGAAGAGFGLASAGWLMVGLILLTSPPGSTSDPLGVFLLAVSAQLALTAIASLASGRFVVGVVDGLIALRFATTAIFELSGAGGWETVAGAVGLALCATAMAAAAATIGQREGGVEDRV